MNELEKANERIAALESECNELRALLTEARAVTESIWYASDYNLVGDRDHQAIYLHTDGFIYDGWNRAIYADNDNLLIVKHFRAIAEFYKKIRWHKYLPFSNGIDK